MGQLAFLHISEDYRSKGIAARLMEEFFASAKANGATSVYVSAAPPESAVGFYRQLDFELTDEVDLDLYAPEPADIHTVEMI